MIIVKYLFISLSIKYDLPQQTLVAIGTSAGVLLFLFLDDAENTKRLGNKPEIRPLLEYTN